MIHAVYLEIVYHSSLGGICLWHYHALEAGSTRGNGHGKNAADRLQRSIEREFAHDHISTEFRSLYHSGTDENGHCYRKVVGRTFFLDIGRSHVYNHLHTAYIIARLHDCRPHTLLAFLDSSIGQADNTILHATVDHRLDGHDNGIDTFYGCRIRLYQHQSRSFLRVSEATDAHGVRHSCVPVESQTM